MTALSLRNSSYALSAAALMVLSTTGCVATRKYTRNQVAPVEARVTANEKKTSDHASAINELENGLSKTDERAMDADRKARAAQQSADAAQQSATQAGQRADAANQAADAARQLAANTGQRLGEVVDNLDNYQLVNTSNILFPVGVSTLNKAAKEQLDQAVSNIANSKNYVLELQGFTDRTGSKTANLALSERRADAVVRYLTAEKQIPLRRIHVLGQGIDPEQKGRNRAARRDARRVEMKVFALNLGQGGAGSQASNMTPGTTTDDATRSRSMNSTTPNSSSFNSTQSTNNGSTTTTPNNSTGATTTTNPPQQ